jgi:acyl-CoA thioester hydrolase
MNNNTMNSKENSPEKKTPVVPKELRHPKYIFETRLEVRDYECDIEGIVNNANYLHYTEHTRHRFLKATGLSFAEMHKRGIDAVVARMNLAYRQPLRCDDEIISRMALRKEGLRWVFFHDLYRASDNQLCFQATVHLVVLVNGRLGESEEYNKAFAKYIEENE